MRKSKIYINDQEKTTTTKKKKLYKIYYLNPFIVLF